jgi:hydroxyacylglutathione hydrolase
MPTYRWQLLLALTLAPLLGQAAPPPLPPLLPATTKIRCIVVNSFWQTNCYLLSNKSGQALLLDAGDEYDWLPSERYRPTGAHVQRILAALKEHRLTLKLIILSHGHLDHCGGLWQLKKETGAQILMHSGDIRPAGDPHAGCPKDARLMEGGLPKVDRQIVDNELIELDGMRLQVVHTPGHSPGGIALVTKLKGRTICFSGDILLRRSVGRTNFRDGSGDADLEAKSIRERLYTLPDDTLVLPGHDAPTTIGEEKRENPFVPALPVPTGDEALPAPPAATTTTK